MRFKIFIDLHKIKDKVVLDSAKSFRDKLEGVVEMEEEDICEIFKEEEGVKDRIHDTLSCHVRYWEETEASDFALSVVRNRYFPQIYEKLHYSNKGINVLCALLNDAHISVTFSQLIFFL